MGQLKDGEKVQVFMDGIGDVDATYRASDDMLIGHDDWLIGTPEEWDGLWTPKYRANAIDRAFEVIGDGKKAVAWLDTPIVALGGKTPVEHGVW